MGRALAPIDLRVVSKVFNEIASARWFEPNETRALAYYLIYRYSRGCDAASLKAQVEPFAREWFRIGLGRLDALDPYVNQTHDEEMTRIAPLRHREVHRAGELLQQNRTWAGIARRKPEGGRPAPVAQ